MTADPLRYPPFSCRVINAGKSALNEDQACCEVVVARRRPMSYCPPSTPSKTPNAKRRNSLPNGEGLRMEYGKMGEVRKCTIHILNLKGCRLFLEVGWL